MDNQKQNETIVDRIRYLIEQSRLSQAQFARRINIDPSNLSKHLSGRLPVSEALINRIVADLGVSKHWLRDGSDVPFAKEPHAAEIALSNPIDLQENLLQGTPVYDIDVTAGCTELSRMFTQDRIIGAINLPQLNSSCNIVRVSGDSMNPVIKNGGLIAIRPIIDRRNIFWGQIYVIVTEDYRMVKYLRRHNDSSKVILHSANPDYDDMEISRNDIYNLYIVEAIINYEQRC